MLIRKQLASLSRFLDQQTPLDYPHDHFFARTEREPRVCDYSFWYRHFDHDARLCVVFANATVIVGRQTGH